MWFLSERAAKVGYEREYTRGVEAKIQFALSHLLFLMYKTMWGLLRKE